MLSQSRLAAVVLFSGLATSLCAADIIVGAGQGGGPQVWQYSASGSLKNSFFATTPSFTGGVRVAAGDVTGDGVYDVIAGAGPGAGPTVRTFSQSGAPVGSFFAFDPGYSGGVYVAAGRVTGFNNPASIIVGTGPTSTPLIKVHNPAGVNTIAVPGFTGGVRVAAGDVNNDGFADIIAGAGPGGGPHVKVFSGLTGTEINSFFAFSPTFAGGVFVASGDVDGDGFADIVTGADAGAGPHVKVFSGSTGAELLSFFAYPQAFQGGVRVAVGDVNGDGFAEIVTGAGPGAGPHVKVFSGQTGVELHSFFAGDPSFLGGVYVAAVPAPGSLGLLAATGLLAMRRRRR